MQVDHVVETLLSDSCPVTNIDLRHCAVQEMITQASTVVTTLSMVHMIRCLFSQIHFLLNKM